MNDPKKDKIVIHHSASSRNTLPADIKAWHLDRGFSDIGYHFVIGARGGITRGRPIWEMGAHVKGHNKGAIGVCVTGDNTKEGSNWIASQIFALEMLIKQLHVIFGPLPIMGHNQLNPKTECPGVGLRYEGGILKLAHFL